METYTQPEKRSARRRIWTTAIRQVCDTEGSSLLNRNHLTHAWTACQRIGRAHGVRLRDRYLHEFLEVIESAYRAKTPRDLRVLFLAGEEPENDVDWLLRAGVRLENIWAVERDPRVADAALESARRKYPTLKIFHGGIEDFLDVAAVKFDIIYLDFTAGLFSRTQKPFRALHKVFLRQTLAPLSALITNYSAPEPDEVDAEADLLTTAFFVEQPLVESVLVDPKSKSVMNDGPAAFGLGHEELQRAVERDRSSACSALYTHYTMAFASVLAPAFRALGRGASRRLLVASDNGVPRRLANGDGARRESSAGMWRWMAAFLDAARGPRLENELWRPPAGSEVSIAESGLLFGRLTNVPPDRRFASERLLRAVKASMSLIPDRTLQLFCDPLMPNLWSQYVIFQLGGPYHTNVGLHERFRYRAKTREMFVDQFVFDQCRPFYDYLGLIDLLDAGIENFSAQFIVRCCMDLLTKNTGQMIYELYFGGNLLGHGEVGAGSFARLGPRRQLRSNPSPPSI